MNKFIVTIDCKSNNKIYFHANNVQRFERYSVIVDENPVTFEYPVIGIEQVPYIIDYQKKRYVLYFGDNNSRVIECVNGRFNPEDPYTFLHDNGILEFEKPITKVEVLALTEASNKFIKDAKERRIEGNCLMQGGHVKIFTRADDIPVMCDTISISNRTSMTVDRKPLGLESPVIGFSTCENSANRGTVYTGDGLTYFILFNQYVQVTPLCINFDGVEFVFDTPVVLDNIRKVQSSENVKEPKDDTSKFFRGVFTPVYIDVFFDKLYMIALERDMLDEAVSLRKISTRPMRKYSRVVLDLINHVEDYEELIKLLHNNEDGRTSLIIDEFWEKANRM